MLLFQLILMTTIYYIMITFLTCLEQEDFDFPVSLSYFLQQIVGGIKKKQNQLEANLQADF